MNIFILLKKLYGLFLRMGFNCLKARATSRRQFSFYQSPQKLLVLILPSSEEWKAESTLEPSSGFEHETLDWESSTLTSKPLTLQKKLTKLLQNLSIYLFISIYLPIYLSIYLYT